MPAPQAPYLLRLAWPAALAIASIAALHPATARAQSTLHAPPPTIIVPFAIDDSTARWAHATVPTHLPPLDRLRRLSRALLAPTLGVAEGAPTSTAIDVFAERRANCVGYANLFVGLARELGVAAYFVLVDGLPGSGAPPTDESHAVREGHLAAAWGPPSDRRVFDFAGETPGARLQLRPITDLVALAGFYPNRRVDAPL